MQPISDLPEYVEIDSVRYKINTDCMTWIRIEHLIFDELEGLGVRLAKILVLAYPKLPENPDKAVERLWWFYLCGKEYNNEAQSADGQLVYDLLEDFDFVWAAFKSEFGIDIEKEPLHWWRFMSLLGCLDDKCRFSQIVGYRAMDLSGIKDKEQLKFYRTMKKRYRLSKETGQEAKLWRLLNGLEGLF